MDEILTDDAVPNAVDAIPVLPVEKALLLSVSALLQLLPPGQ